MRAVNQVHEQHPCLTRSFTRKWIPGGRVDYGKAMIRGMNARWHASPCGDHEDAYNHLEQGQGHSRVV
jgi:hypothetical protein